jgi:hypothetical protein
MQQQQDTNFDLSAAVRAAVDTALAGNGLLRVNDAAHFIIVEHGLSPLEQPAIIDALCRQCIRCGVSIEFQTNESNGQLA